MSDIVVVHVMLPKELTYQGRPNEYGGDRFVLRVTIPQNVGPKKDLPDSPRQLGPIEISFDDYVLARASLLSEAPHLRRMCTGMENPPWDVVSVPHLDKILFGEDEE